jgi:hypothetical protein
MKPIAVAAVSGKSGLLDIFAEGPDTAMFNKTFFNGWTGWEALAGVFNYPPVAVALDSTTVHLFGVGTDYAMFHKSRSNGVWSPSESTWDSLGGVFDSPPAAVSWAANRIDVFGIGGNKEVFHKFFDGTQFSASWESLGGEFVGGVAAVSWGPNRIDLFAVGTNNVMFHKFFDGQWKPSQTGWESLGGEFSSPPTAVSWAANRLDIFAVGTDFGMFHKAFDNGWLPSPSGWDALGGTFNSQPAVASWAANRLDVFGLGTNNAIFHKFWDGKWQATWENLGGESGSAPAVVAWGPQRLDLFAVGTDRDMLHKFWDGTQWKPSESAWESLGGVFDHPPVPGPAAAPPFGLGSNSNYTLSSNCTPLLDVSVIIDVTEDIVCQSASGSQQGFGFQLNAYSPKGDACAYQQYVIALFGNELTGAIDNWPVDVKSGDLFHSFPSLTSLPEAKLPAGFILKILLENDKTGNIIGVRWVVIDNLGHELVNQRESTFAAGGDPAQLAPIVAFEVDFVGPVNAETAVLSSGAGTITYKASNVLTVTSEKPACTDEMVVTLEKANTFYGFMPTGTSKTFTQSFSVNPGEPAINRPGKARPETPRP